MIREKYGSPESYPSEGEWNQEYWFVKSWIEKCKSENSNQDIQVITNKDEICKEYKLIMHQSLKRKNGNATALFKT